MRQQQNPYLFYWACHELYGVTCDVSFSWKWICFGTEKPRTSPAARETPPSSC